MDFGSIEGSDALLDAIQKASEAIAKDAGVKNLSNVKSVTISIELGNGDTYYLTVDFSKNPASVDANVLKKDGDLKNLFEDKVNIP